MPGISNFSVVGRKVARARAGKFVAGKTERHLCPRFETVPFGAIFRQILFLVQFSVLYWLRIKVQQLLRSVELMALEQSALLLSRQLAGKLAEDIWWGKSTGRLGTKHWIGIFMSSHFNWIMALKSQWWSRGCTDVERLHEWLVENCTFFVFAGIYLLLVGPSHCVLCVSEIAPPPLSP